MFRSRISNIILVVVLLLLCSTASFAAVAVDSQMPSNAGTSSINNPHTFNFTNTAGNVLVCSTVVTTPYPPGGALGATGTPTYDGQSMTLGKEQTITDVGTGFLAVRVSLWYLASPHTGSNLSFSVAPGTNYGQTIAGCVSFTGGHASPLGTSQGVQNTSSVSSSSLPAFTTTAGSAVVDIIATGSGGNSSSKTMTWSNDGVSGAYYARWSTSSYTTTSNPTMSYTFTSDAYLMAGIEILAAAGGGPTCRSAMMLMGAGGC